MSVNCKLDILFELIKLISFKDVQLANIFPISITDEISKPLPKSNEIKEVQLANIELILITLLV